MNSAVYFIFFFFLFVVVFWLGLNLYWNKDTYVDDFCDADSSMKSWFSCGRKISLDRRQLMVLFVIGIIFLLFILGYFLYDYYNSTKISIDSSDTTVVYKQLAQASNNREKLRILNNNSTVVERTPALKDLKCSLSDSASNLVVNDLDNLMFRTVY